MSGRCAALLVLSVVLAQAAWAEPYAVRRVAGSLKDMPTTFSRAAHAPATELRPAGVDGSLRSMPAASSFQSVQGPATVFREAEIPPERLQLTRELIASLQARQTEQQAIVVDLPADVLFDFDQATLRPDAQASLDKAAELLRSYPGAPVHINGHTDAKGSDSYNDALSLRRAQAVAQALQQRGSGALQTAGFGKRRPVAPNAQPDGRDDPAGRQRNRRVEIVIDPAAASGKR